MERLKQLRRARGLSLDALAERMEGIVTKQALSKYETGKANPTPRVVMALAKALEVSPTDMIGAPEVGVEFIAYRKGAGLRKKQQAQVESLIERVLEERIRLQEMTGQIDAFALPVRDIAVTSVADAERAADELRALWGLADGPIADMTALLEDHLIHVVEIEADEKFDGISAVIHALGGKAQGAGIVTRRGLPGERQRMNLAHELGHLVLKLGDEVDEEKAAFRFAGAFLLPAEALYREVGRKRGFVQGEELLMLKLKYGVSVQALLYRLQALGIIGTGHYKQWCIAINAQGYRKSEPHELPSEQPQWLRRTVLRGLAEGLLTKEKAERLLGEPVASDARTTHLPIRRTLMRSSASERRRALREQAEAIATVSSEAGETTGQTRTRRRRTEP